MLATRKTLIALLRECAACSVTSRENVAYMLDNDGVLTDAQVSAVLTYMTKLHMDQCHVH